MRVRQRQRQQQQRWGRRSPSPRPALSMACRICCTSDPGPPPLAGPRARRGAGGAAEGPACSPMTWGRGAQGHRSRLYATNRCRFHAHAGHRTRRKCRMAEGAPAPPAGAAAVSGVCACPRPTSSSAARPPSTSSAPPSHPPPAPSIIRCTAVARPTTPAPPAPAPPAGDAAAARRAAATVAGAPGGTGAAGRRMENPGGDPVCRGERPGVGERHVG